MVSSGAAEWPAGAGRRSAGREEARAAVLSARLGEGDMAAVVAAARGCGLPVASWCSAVVEAMAGAGPPPSGSAAESAALRAVREAAVEVGWVVELAAVFSGGGQVPALERWPAAAALERRSRSVRDAARRRERSAAAERAQQAEAVCRRAAWAAGAAEGPGGSLRVAFRTSPAVREAVMGICSPNGRSASRFLGAVLGGTAARWPAADPPPEVRAAGELAAGVRERARSVFGRAEEAERSGVGWDAIREEMVMSGEELSEVERLLRRAAAGGDGEDGGGVNHAALAEALGPDGDWVGPLLAEPIHVERPARPEGGAP